MSDRQLLWTIRDVAQATKLCERTLFSLVKSGELPHLKIGRSLRFSVKEIEQWIESKASKSATVNDSC